MKSKIDSIQVLGSGCPNCEKLLDITRQVVKDLKLMVEVEYVKEIDKMIALGIMSTPALVVNNKPVISGRLPSLEEVKNIIQNL